MSKHEWEISIKFDLKTAIIVVLAIIVLVLTFFLWKNMWNNWQNNPISNSQTWVVAAKDIVMTVIWDTRCKECFTSEILSQLKLVPELQNAKIVEKDFSDKWVKEYLQENKIEALPAVIFNKSSIEKTIDTYLKPIESWEFSLLLWATFNPFSEICDNNIDDTWNWQIDCQDTSCSSQPICRVEEKAKLDVFLMGYCPFGEIAAKAIPSLKEAFSDSLNIDIHYIATKTWEWNTANDFNSLHWVSEVEENIRQLCIKKYNWVDTLISYFTERYKNADNYGQVKDEPSLAYNAVWIDWKKIDACITNWEWAKLLEEDIKLAEELNITASPTWLANNKYTFWGIEAGAIQSEFCKYNSNLEWCNNKIAANTSVANSTPSCNQ